MNYLIFGIFLAGIFAAPAQPARAADAGLSGALAGFGLAWKDAGACALDKIYTRGDCSSGKRCFSTVTAVCPGFQLRLEIVSGIEEKDARKYMLARLTRVRMLYGGYAEYPGMATTRTEVPPELTARYVEKGPLGSEALYMPATERLAYGPGAKDLVKYSAALSSRYCAGAKTLGQVEIFAPKDTAPAALDAFLGEISCGKAAGGR
ncbi:MAG TPA: hypothetical protein PKI19_08075 [Elusimicrobiales bacterium]|nr:hypothetical protein [Elusimicrobiales bacterium]